MVAVGEKCKECMYWSQRTESCDYRFITGMSRTLTNNQRVDPSMCDKFTKGKVANRRSNWAKEWYK